MQEFTVAENNVGQRFDLYLTLSMPQYSRTNVRKLLDLGKVKVNGEVEYRPNYRVVLGDKVEVESELELTRQHLAGWNTPVEIVYQDADLLIVNKPIGMNVHPVGANDTNSLLNAVYFKLAGQLTEFGVNLVNRIDKDTSGLVVMALSPQGAWYYAQQFAKSQVKKEYLAVVSSRWNVRYGEELVRESGFMRYDFEERKQMMVQTRGEHAETHFKFLQDTNHSKWSIVYAFPITGRTHQIRAHLAHIQFPILGDTKYDGKEYKRLMLHAYSITIPKFGGGELTVKTDWPKEFDSIDIE